MHPSITEHARTRMQQRGISPAALELLLDFPSASSPRARQAPQSPGAQS